MRRFLLSAAIATSLSGGTVRAQAPSPDMQKFASFVVSEPHKQAILAAAAQAAQQIPGLCTSARFTFTSKFAVVVPPEFGADGVPVKGLWKEVVDSEGCGGQLAYNLLVGVTPEKGVTIAPWIPGDGRTDITLTRDAMIGAFQYAAVKNPGCQSNRVITAKFEAYEGDPIPDALHGPNSRAWRETWTVWSCGTKLDVPFGFTPNAKGTSWRLLEPLRPGTP